MKFTHYFLLTVSNQSKLFSSYFFSIFLFLFITPVMVLAEGTKQLAPNSTDRVFLYMNSSTYNDFGRYNGMDDQRLYFHIADPNAEQVYLGFSKPVNSGHFPCSGTFIDLYFRIKDPTGRIVYPVPDSPNGQLIDSTSANINTYNQAVAGPQPIVGSNGYTPILFDPSGLPAGDYYIEFSRDIDNESLNNPIAIEWFDISVGTKTVNPVAINGRVFARNWALFAPSISCGNDSDFSWFDRPFNGNFFVYTDENIVSKADFNNAGFQPAAFNVVFNDAGTTRTNDVIEDRKSRNGIRSTASQHRIFLNNPDLLVYPTGVLGEFALTPRYLSCENGAGCVQAVMTEPGQVEVLLDLSGNIGEFIYDIGSRDVLIAFKVDPAPGEQPPYARCIPWDGVDGLGDPVENIDSIELLTKYTQGIYHFPIYDAEYMLNGFDVTTIRPIPNNGSPKRIYYDDTTIPDAYGVGLTQPKENPFNGCGVPCHPWTNIDFGNLNTINTWFFAREEDALRLEIGDCPIEAINDTTFTKANTPKTVTILANDFGTENVDSNHISIEVLPINGTALFDTTLFASIYTPNPGFVGLDSFAYTICYNVLPVGNLCDSAFVFITIAPSPEDCGNALDDDGDGLVDCDDPDCFPSKPSIIHRKQD